MVAEPNQIYISVVTPVFNERNTLEELYTRLIRTLEDTGHTFEVIFVDDGSTDGSLDLLRAQPSTPGWLPCAVP